MCGTYYERYTLIYICLMSLWCTVETITKFSVARAVPGVNVALAGSPMTTLTGISRTQCLKECIGWNCSAFNYGDNTCELLKVYLCEDVETLNGRSNYKYYDVETEDLVGVADDYRSETNCLTMNRCSPKCYLYTTTTTTTTTTSTTTTTTPTTTTTTPTTTTTTTTTPTTTTTTPTTTTPTTTTTTPTTTTTTPTTTTTTPTTTTTTPTTTTTTPTTTTTTPTTTTTTPTTTTTTPTTTTTTPTTTTTAAATAGPPGPGDVGYACSSDGDCTPTPNSDCRSFSVCECVAGYSYNPPTKTCVITCPGNYGSDYFRTAGHYIFSNNHAVYSDFGVVNVQYCKDQCTATPGCKSMEYDTILTSCNIALITKAGAGGDWNPHPFFDYYQRNCEA